MFYFSNWKDVLWIKIIINAFKIWKTKWDKMSEGSLKSDAFLLLKSFFNFNFQWQYSCKSSFSQCNMRLFCRCEMDWHAPPGWQDSPGRTGEAWLAARRRWRHDEGAPGLRLHAPRPGTLAGHRRARRGRLPGGQAEKNSVMVTVTSIGLQMRLWQGRSWHRRWCS